MGGSNSATSVNHGFKWQRDGRATSNASHAFIWSANTGMLDLNDLIIPARSGWLLIDAHAINLRGEIAGIGTINGETPAFLLIPKATSTSGEGVCPPSVHKRTSFFRPFRDELGLVSVAKAEPPGQSYRCRNLSLSETQCSIFDSMEIYEAATRQLYLTRGILLSLLQLSLVRGFAEIISKR